MTPRPPAHVEPYVRALGADRAVEFLLAYGGSEVYLARRPGTRSMVAERFGAEAVSRLAALDLPARVPTAKPWLAQVLQARGLSQAEIARRLHVTDVTVRRMLARGPDAPREDPRQPRLF